MWIWSSCSPDSPDGDEVSVSLFTFTVHLLNCFLQHWILGGYVSCDSNWFLQILDFFHSPWWNNLQCMMSSIGRQTFRQCLSLPCHLKSEITTGGFGSYSIFWPHYIGKKFIVPNLFVMCVKREKLIQVYQLCVYYHNIYGRKVVKTDISIKKSVKYVTPLLYYIVIRIPR